MNAARKLKKELNKIETDIIPCQIAKKGHLKVRKIKKSLYLLIFPLVLFFCNSAQAYWSLEVGTGVPYNFPTSLKIKQSNEPDIDMTAYYDSDPFRSPFYHDLRIGKWDGNTAWEFEDIHHKIYLRNTNSDVEHFSISHGYNLFYVDRAWLVPYCFIWRLGAGVVVAHPESTIRGKTFDESGGTLNNGGYYLAGPSAMTSIGKRFYLTKAFFVEIEGKITASYAWVKVVDGMAQAPNIALHGNFGIGYDFG